MCVHYAGSLNVTKARTMGASLYIYFFYRMSLHPVILSCIHSRCTLSFEMPVREASTRHSFGFTIALPTKTGFSFFHPTKTKKNC